MRKRVNEYKNKSVILVCVTRYIVLCKIYNHHKSFTCEIHRLTQVTNLPTQF